MRDKGLTRKLWAVPVGGLSSILNHYDISCSVLGQQVLHQKCAKPGAWTLVQLHKHGNKLDAGQYREKVRTVDCRLQQDSFAADLFHNRSLAELRELRELRECSLHSSKKAASRRPPLRSGSWSSRRLQNVAL